MLQASCAPSCPERIRLSADEFKDILGKHYKSFVAVLCGYIFGVASISDIVRFFLFSPSLSEINRMYNASNLSPKLNRRQRRIVQKIINSGNKSKMRYVWAVDDTIIPHYGKDIWGTYSWFDHCTNSIVHSHKLMTLGLVDTHNNIFIPVKWEIIHKDNGHNKKKHEKGWMVALRLLKEALEEKFPQAPFVADSWFSGEEFFEEIEKLNIPFIMEIKNNRKVSSYGNKKIGKSVSIFFEGIKRIKIMFRGKIKWAASAVVTLKDSKIKIKVVAVANKKGLTDKPFSYYVCNRLTWDENKIWSIARYRWSIEVQFRELKQIFALGKAAVRSKNSVETSISMSMIALTVIRRDQIDNANTNKNQYVKLKPASEIVSEIKLDSFNVFISKLASPTESVFFKKFRSRFSKKNLKNKPTVVYEETYVYA